MSVFQLGRMRHLDLLAMWHRLNPDGHEGTGIRLAQASIGILVKAIHPGP